MTAPNEELLVGLVSISDRASQGVYKDEGMPGARGMVRKSGRVARLCAW